MTLFKDSIKSLLILPFRALSVILLLLEWVIGKISRSTIFSLSGRELIIKKFDNETREVVNDSNNKIINFLLHTPNQICLMRQESFFTKEPEMLEWIEKYGGNGAFYDIGANIGIYSIYFAKLKTGNVYSFEPSVFNLRQLAKNISINELSERIRIIPNPLSDKTGLAPFINSTTDEGGALNAFGVKYGHNGLEINNEVEYSLLGFSLDDLLAQGFIDEPPSMIKIDVDGIEDLILSGAKNTLSAKSCKTIYIEVDDNFIELASNTKIFLENAGFSLIEKRQSEIFSASEYFSTTYNQIWVKT